MRKCHCQYGALPVGGSTDWRIKKKERHHTHTERHTHMHIYTKGESLERLKVTVSHIWGADPNGRWQRRGPGSAARGAVTCGTQRTGESRPHPVSVCNPPPERNVWVMVKGAVVPHFHPLLITT